MTRAFALFAVLGVAIPAAAQPAAPSAEAIREAEAAQTAYDAGDFAAALEHFERARALYPDPTLTYNVARCHERLGHASEAAAAYRSYLSEAGTLSDVDRREVEAAIERSDAAARTATPDTPAPVTAPAPSTPDGAEDGLGLPFWIAAGVAGLGAVTAVAFNFVALGEQRRLGCGTYDDAAMCGTANGYTTITVVGGAVAIAAAGVAVYLYLSAD